MQLPARMSKNRKKRWKMVLLMVLIVNVMSACSSTNIPEKADGDNLLEKADDYNLTHKANGDSLTEKFESDNLSEETSGSDLSTLLHNPQEAKKVLDDKDITDLTIDYSSKIEIEKILNQESGYESYYENMIKLVEASSYADPNFLFYEEEGYYICKVPIYHFNVLDNTINNEVQIILFSKDMTKQAVASYFIGMQDDVMTQILYSCGNLNVLSAAP